MFGKCDKFDIIDLLCSPCYSSQFEEKFEENNGDVAPNLPTSPEFNKHQSIVVSEDRGKDLEEMPGQDVHGPSSDFPASQDFVNGIMKIVPSDFDVSMTIVFDIFALWISK